MIPPIVDTPTDYQKQRLHENYVLDKERTIILAPYANSTANLQEAFWVKLISEPIDWKADLNVNFNHTNSRAFYIASDSDQTGIRTFMRQNKINSIDDLNFYGRIEGKNVVLNADSLLEKIIGAVD